MRIFLLRLAFSLSFLMAIPAFAQDANTLPKYGGIEKNAAMKAADEKFLASIDAMFKGDRRKAANEIASRGWQLFRSGSPKEAIKRFNQAWLADSSNASALWGMAVYQASNGKAQDALTLFAEAEPQLRDDIDFSVDYARTLGIAGVESRNAAWVNDAFSRFDMAHKRKPDHTLNLQNWAITLFYIGRYDEAWQKVKLAEATPRRNEIDPAFIAALSAKKPRP